MQPGEAAPIPAAKRLHQKHCSVDVHRPVHKALAQNTRLEDTVRFEPQALGVVDDMAVVGYRSGARWLSVQPESARKSLAGRDHIRGSSAIPPEFPACLQTEKRVRFCHSRGARK